MIVPLFTHFKIDCSCANFTCHMLHVIAHWFCLACVCHVSCLIESLMCSNVILCESCDALSSYVLLFWLSMWLHSLVPNCVTWFSWLTINMICHALGSYLGTLTSFLSSFHLICSHLCHWCLPWLVYMLFALPCTYCLSYAYIWLYLCSNLVDASKM